VRGLNVGGRQVTPGAILVALVVVAVGVLALTQLGGTDSSAPSAKVGAKHEDAAPAPSQPAEAAKTPTDGEVRSLLKTYTDRYGAEDAAGLGELFAADAVRYSEGKTQNRAEAIATYREQFSQLTDPTYSLSGLQIDTEPGAARVAGRYRISSSTGTVTGGVVYRLVDGDGHLVIKRLDIQPD
jgi:hypothetical protein